MVVPHRDQVRRVQQTHHLMGKLETLEHSETSEHLEAPELV
jgi:hypothetical protein